MNLPNNGKVIIVDDNPKDVEDLMDALTREKMPFLFFKDLGLDDMPETPINNVRLLFLDLDLGLGGNGPIENIRLVQQRIVKLIEPYTPYVLVIWSTYEDQFSKTLFEEFKGRFKEYAPIEYCSLEKQEIQNIKKSGQKVIELIRSKLKERLAGFNSFNLFLLWESLINNACGESINSLINSSRQETGNSNKELKTIIKKLANAYLGRRIENADNKIIQRAAMFTFNDLFKESIEKEILKSDLIDDLEFSDINPANSALIAKLNSKLLLEVDVENDRSPGNVYTLLKEEQEIVNKEIREKTKLPWIDNIIVKRSVKEFCKKNIEESEKREASQKEINNLSGELINQVTQEAILIEVEISPICDYAQKKRILSRSVKGCLFPSGIIDENCFKSKTDYLFISPLFEFNTKQYRLVLDLRLFTAAYLSEGDKTDPIFKVRHQLLSEIQINVSKHISRTGLTYLDERDY